MIINSPIIGAGGVEIENGIWEDADSVNLKETAWWDRYVFGKEDTAVSSNKLVLEDAEGVYETEGYRTSKPIPLSLITAVKSSNIKWNSTTPADTDIKIYTAVNEDDTTEPTYPDDYSEATDDSSIPSISADQDLTGKYLWTRAELSTSDTNETPRLTTLEYSVESEDKVNFFKFF